MGEPSVDCLLMRARLIYAKRVLENGPPQLHALLHNNGMPLKWTKQIQSDIEMLQTKTQTIQLSCDRTGRSISDSSPWDALTHCPMEIWRRQAATVFWDESVADPNTSAKKCEQQLAELSFCCHECTDQSKGTVI